MDIHRCSQEGERVASNKGDGLSIKSESGVVGPAIASLDCHDMHLGTLAFMPDHDSQASVVERRVWQEDGPSERREVSSAYCSRLDRCENAGSVHPRLECRLVMVSTRVFMTVLNTSTDRGSPWKTPSWTK